MKIDLYLISPHEEYAGKHACRRHWNYQWRARRGSPYDEVYSKIRLRKESFGGLLMNSDGRLFKVDKSGFDVLRLFMDGANPSKIVKKLNVNEREAEHFFKKLKQLGIVS